MLVSTLLSWPFELIDNKTNRCVIIHFLSLVYLAIHFSSLLFYLISLHLWLLCISPVVTFIVWCHQIEHEPIDLWLKPTVNPSLAGINTWLLTMNSFSYYMQNCVVNELACIIHLPKASVICLLNTNNYPVAVSLHQDVSPLSIWQKLMNFFDMVGLHLGWFFSFIFMP